jgi:hypothetical protein
MYDICSNSLISFIHVRHRSDLEMFMIVFDVQVFCTSPTSFGHLNDYRSYLLFVQVCMKNATSKSQGAALSLK